MTEYIHYAKKKNAESWMEEVVLETKRPLTEAEHAEFLHRLDANGMEFVRVWEYNGEAPDFAKVVNV